MRLQASTQAWMAGAACLRLPHHSWLCPDSGPFSVEEREKGLGVEWRRNSLRKWPLLRDPSPSPPQPGHLPSTHLLCQAPWPTDPSCLKSLGRSVPSVTPPVSPSFSSAALTSPLLWCCRKRSSLRGRRRATSSPAVIDHRMEEPFRSRGRASCTAAGASGRTCILNSWGRSRRNT